MHCMICESEMEYYFSKTYSKHPFDQFMRDVGTVDFQKCRNCGFVISKTHVDLNPDRWAKLNSEFHNYFEDPKNRLEDNQPPYLEQAMMLLLLGSHGIVDVTDMVDYAAGYGTLSRLLRNYFKIHLPIFDPYVQNGDRDRYIRECDLRKYKTVVNSAMFEHALSRDDIDRVNDLVDSDGCLILHTVVCETVPRDPEWFYLRPPVHSAFYTNKSMGILMDRWGYHSSIYCPKSKCWALLRKRDSTIADRLNVLNKELQSDWFYFKKGFMDYWKGF